MIGLSICVLAISAGIYYFASSIECLDGFEGEGCVDIDECSTSKHTCYRDFKCRNTPGSFECYCSDGFNATEDDCVDIDECERNQPCDSNFHCTNSIGSYSCDCLGGFKLNLMKDVLFCVDIDECAGQDICPKKSKCNNSKGSYVCNCLDGYEGYFCDDIDECNNTATCHANAQCLNNEGSFTCSCKEGYYGTGDSCFPGQCQDANCPENQKCVQAITIDCECKEGFRLNSSSVCVDIDECQENKCNDLKCLNTVGSYNCERISTTSLTTTTKMTTTKNQGSSLSSTSECESPNFDFTDYNLYLSIIKYKSYSL